MSKNNADTKSQEFKNFEGLVKSLLTVPKREVEKEKAKYERRKQPEVEKRGK